mgnify:CR=1 FL=1
MAKNMQPVLKRCRTLGVSPAAMGYNKTSNKNPGGQRRAKKSEYATQLTEKQKVKFVYGIQEKQFRNYYEKAARMPGNTGDNLLTLVERRLDNVVYRAGFGMSRRQARQLVLHRHFTVNGERVNIPSYLVKPGDVIAVHGSACDKIKENVELDSARPVPMWMSFEANDMKVTFNRLPERSEIDLDVEEHLIVELYSK